MPEQRRVAPEPAVARPPAVAAGVEQAVARRRLQAQQRVRRAHPGQRRRRVAAGHRAPEARVDVLEVDAAALAHVPPRRRVAVAAVEARGQGVGAPLAGVGRRRRAAPAALWLLWIGGGG